MPFQEEQPSLMGTFAWIPLKPVVRKRLVGGRCLTLFNYLACTGFQYESGAILGRALRSRLPVFERVLAQPKSEGDFIQFLQYMAKKRLDEFHEYVAKQEEDDRWFLQLTAKHRPDKLLEWRYELENRAKQEYPNKQPAKFSVLAEFILREELFYEIPRVPSEERLEALNENISLESVLDSLRRFGEEGIGFGSQFPELTERMYRSHENIDMDEWSDARKHGLDIPERPDIVSLEEREQSALQILAAYASEFYPELLEPLGLVGYSES